MSWLEPLVFTTLRPDGTRWYEKWCLLNGRFHRLDGPAVVDYYEDGVKVAYEAWWSNGKQHCRDRPAIVNYYEDGTVEYEGWYRDDKLHREDGPAVTACHRDGSVKYQEWWLNGKQLVK